MVRDPRGARGVLSSGSPATLATSAGCRSVPSTPAIRGPPATTSTCSRSSRPTMTPPSSDPPRPRRPRPRRRRGLSRCRSGAAPSSRTATRCAPATRSARSLELVRATGGTLLMPADERNKHPGIAANADPVGRVGRVRPRAGAGRRRHDAARAAAVPRHAGAGHGRQLRPRRLPHVARPRTSSPRGCPRCCRAGSRPSACRPSSSSTRARGTRPSTTCWCRARRTAAWRRSAGRSTASIWASAAATASSSPPRSARPATTSRPAAR